MGADMGQIIQFVSKSERERIRLIQEARAIYDSIFPPADPVSERSGGASAHRSDGGNLA
ncbi:hypothetical protein [Bradyrhizobium sp. RT6a]|jgi:hypothetical protein|uniref:hypothetical protein n=2 Tax=unclassified Bradyrhizobium TaxID=2631580 RepID=UPI003395EE30